MAHSRVGTPNTGLTRHLGFETMASVQTIRTNAMNTPLPKQPEGPSRLPPHQPPRSLSPSPSTAPRSTDESQIRAWLKLRRELAELHAQLVYLNLIMSLGVRQSRVEASATHSLGVPRDSLRRPIIHRKTNM